MTILEEIVSRKKKEVQDKMGNIDRKTLEKSHFFRQECRSMKHALKNNNPAIIAEFKKKSPSGGTINYGAEVETVTTGYARSGAAGLSVLTDFAYFGGRNRDLTAARNLNPIPVLRKEFIIAEYQILESKAIGADAILLIAAVLEKEQIRVFTKTARGLGMEVLCEVHDEQELDKVDAGADIIGVNNRNLNTLEVNTATSLHMAGLIPGEVCKISESGLQDPQRIVKLIKAGYDGFLMGEYFMKHEKPALAMEAFMQKLNEGHAVS